MRLLIAMLALLVGGTANSNAADWKASEVVTSYVSGTSPTMILGFDNNLEICLALREPGTSTDLLARGIPHTRSQLVLLQLWNLVERSEGEALRCTVPVIDSTVSAHIQTRAEAVAEKVLAAVGTSIDSYLETVSDAGWPQSRYALLGSFVLDGLVWHALERLDAIESADASAMPNGSEYWSGVTWITLAPQRDKLGTNSHATDEGMFFAAWTPSALEAQQVLQQQGLRETLTAIAFGRSETSAEQAGTFHELGLVIDGKAAIPAIAMDSSLCVEGGELAMQVGRALLATGEMSEIASLTKAQNESVAMIMAYHWVYPALLGRLEAAGLEPPAVFQGEPGAALGPSVYAVKGTAVECVSAAD